MPEGVTAFGPFTLDPASGRLRRGNELLHLRPKTWEVLCLLVANPGQLLTKEDIIAAVWHGTSVSDTMPSISVAELRRALDDDARSPAYIETVHGRGFRFRGTLRSDAAAPAAPSVPVVTPADPPLGHTAAAAPFVGRDSELGDLLAFVRGNDSGSRVALVCGEAGIGKTTLVDRLAEQLAAARGGYVIGRGQCLAHFGDAYAYLPVLGALRTMARARADVVAQLRELAPSWLARLPELSTPEELRALRSRSEHAGAGQSAEEMFTLLRALGPVVWVLEDLHWADEATLELLALAAETSAPEQLRIIGTLRLAEALAGARGIARTRRELRRRGRCRDIVLEGLSQAGVEHYLAARFPGMHAPAWLPQRLLAHTSGNPFFLVHTVDNLHALDVLDRTEPRTPRDEQALMEALDAIPATLRDLVQDEIAMLATEERDVLGAASLAGLETDAATIAAALGAPVARVDVVCTELARRGAVLTRVGESAWPDGVVSGRYAFRHALYQKALYEDQAPAARRQAHCRIAETLAAVFADRGNELAAIIADHFERGGDADRAITHHELAARDARRRYSSREAVLHLRRALELLGGIADRAGREATILRDLGEVLPAIQGFADPVMLELYMRARSLQASGASASGELNTIAGSLLANLMQHRPQPAEELAHELLEMAARQQDPHAHALAEMLMGAVHYHRGDMLGAIDHADRSLAIAPSGVTLGPIDHACTALSMSGAALWQAGRPSQGRQRVLEALERARSGMDPFNLLIVLQPVAAIHHWCGDADALLQVAQELGAVVRDQGITQAKACADLLEAWAQHELGRSDIAAAKVADGVAALREHGTMMQTVYLLTVAAEVLAGLGRATEALALLDDAAARIADGTERWWEPELYRCRAMVLGAQDSPEARREVAACLQRSLDLAAVQSADSLRLRSALALAQLQRRKGRAEMRRLVESALGAIVGGADTRDVRAAQQWLR